MTVTPKSGRKHSPAILVAAGSLLALAGLLYILFTPKAFLASATVRVWKSGSVQTDRPTAAYDPVSALPVECDLVRSQTILDPVIQNLGLNELWGRRYNHGVTLQTGDTRARLRLMIEAAPVPKAGLVKVSVTDDDPVEAAALANEIVRAYHAHRGQERDALAQEAVNDLGRQLAGLNDIIAQAEFNRLRLARVIANAPATNSLQLVTPELFELTRSNHLVWQAKYDEQNRQVTRLKSMDRQQLQAALATPEFGTNLVLTQTLVQLSQARDRLLALQSANGPASPEVRQAEAAVSELERITAQALDNLLAAREAELAALKAEFDESNRQLSHLTTNEDQSIALHPDYRDALAELKRLQAQRDALQQRLKLEDSRKAFLPVVTLD